VTTAGIVLGAVLAAAAIVLVALPFLREPTTADDTLVVPDEERIRLTEDRDRALAALKELEFDHRTGKVGDDDYRELVSPLRQEAAAALRAIDRYGPAMDIPEPSPPPDEGNPPTPAPVPEPYPPPGEADIPED
jgi:hypothetical protein